MGGTAPSIWHPALRSRSPTTATYEEPEEEHDDEPPAVAWVPAGNGPDSNWLRLLAPALAFRDHISMETLLPGAWRTMDTSPEVEGARWPTGCIVESPILTRALNHYGRKCHERGCRSLVLFVVIQHERAGWCAAPPGTREELERVGWPHHPKVLCATHLKEASTPPNPERKPKRGRSVNRPPSCNRALTNDGVAELART